MATEEAQLNSVFEQYKKDVAFGAVDTESGLKEFNDALYAAGLQTVMDEKQRQLDAWLAEAEATVQERFRAGGVIMEN